MAVFRNHTIRDGDTLPFIAQSYYDNMGRWQDLADYNDLKYPYIVDTVEEKMENPNHLVTYGDIIVIKFEQDSFTTDEFERTLSRQDKDNIYGLALGKDFDLIGNEEGIEETFSDSIVSLSENAHGDVATRVGLRNLKQALTMRLLTHRGSYIGHPNYGSRIQEYIGRYNNIETATLVSTEIERTLRTDGRVENVSLISHRVERQSYYGEFEVQPMNFDESFRFVVTTEGLLVVVA